MRGRIVLAAASWLTVGCAGSVDDPLAADDEGGTERSACEHSLGGAPWDDDSLPEAQLDFEKALAETPLEGLPASLDVSGLDALSLALVAYALDRPQQRLLDGLDPATVDVERPLARAVLAAFARRDGEGLDSAFLRRGLHRYYACDRDLPLTLDEFVERYGPWSDAPTSEIAESVPKLAPRRLFAHADPDVHVAVSSTPEGDEVEVVLENHREDGALEFLAYDERGDLVDRAPLAMTSELSVLPAPFTCALCHREVFANEFTIVHP